MTSEVVRRAADAIERLAQRHDRPLVAVDGPDAAGKTWLADAVAAQLTAAVCRASIDGFHLPAKTRHRRGALSAEGCYHDSFDYDAVIERLLVPFASGGDVVATSVFDYRFDEAREEIVRVSPRAVLLVDGVFLLRPELREQWTCAIYLHVSEDVTMSRALQRDVDSMGSPEAVIERYRQRYLPAQQLYRAEARPLESAHIVIDNSDVSRPRVVSWNPSGT
ncbi:MAG TPA: hypothetical protein VJ831_12925 [Jatrophihabitantaceae bacterium]|nr:hypothetical protein [Jatrophihabitantaceae bacterium]